MKNAKQFVSILLACLFCISSFIGCSGDTGADVDTTQADTTASDTTAPVDEKWPEVEGTVIYVDVTAEEGGDGTKDNPFKNITEA